MIPSRHDQSYPSSRPHRSHRTRSGRPRGAAGVVRPRSSDEPAVPRRARRRASRRRGREGGQCARRAQHRGGVAARLPGEGGHELRGGRRSGAHRPALGARWSRDRVRAGRRAERQGRIPEPAQPRQRRRAGGVDRGGDRRDATTPERGTHAGGIAQGRPRGVRAPRPGVVDLARRHVGAGRTADPRARVGALAPLVARRRDARVRERPGRPRVHRGVRRGDQVAALSRRERRPSWRVAGTGGPPAALTRGTDLEWTPVVTADGQAVAFIRAGTRTPPRPVLVGMSGGAPRDLAPGAIPPQFPEAALVDPQPVLFPAADGMTIHAQLFLPRGLKPGERRPAVVFFHGGSRRQMLLGWHYFYYYRNAYALNQYFASRGYVVLSVNYRSGIAYGMEFREALHYGAPGASEFNDVLGAGLYLRGRP